MINLWTVINNKVQFNETELTIIENIKPFRDLYHLISIEADRVKLFTYVWLCSDYRSPLIQQGLTEVELHNRSIEMSGLRSEFVASPLIKDCIVIYKVAQYDVIEEQFISIKQAYHNTALIVQTLNKSITKLLIKADKNELKAEEVDKLYTTHNQVIKIGDDLAKRFNIIQDLEAKLSAHRSTTKKLRGAKEYRTSMDGDRV